MTPPSEICPLQEDFDPTFPAQLWRMLGILFSTIATKEQVHETMCPEFSVEAVQQLWLMAELKQRMVLA